MIFIGFYKDLNEGVTLNKQKVSVQFGQYNFFVDMCSINQGLWLILRKSELSKMLKHLHQQKKFVVYWEQQIMFAGLFLTPIILCDLTQECRKNL